MNTLQYASLFIIDTLFTLYLYVLLLRFFFQVLRVDFYNPISQFIVKLTSPFVIPLRKIIPGFFGLDCATIALIMLIAYLKLALISAIAAPFAPPWGLLIIKTIGHVIGLSLNLFFYAIIIHILMSWLAPHTYSPVRTILYQLAEPILRPFRRWTPPIAGLDISPIFALLALKLGQILFVMPLGGL